MKIHKYLVTAAIVILSLGLTITAQITDNSAIKSDRKNIEQWEIIADKINAFGEENNRIIQYEGNVEARMDEYLIRADQLTVYKTKKKTIAQGSVVFMKKEQSISCSLLEFYFDTEIKKLIITF